MGLDFPSLVASWFSVRSVTLLAVRVIFLPVALLIFGEGAIPWYHHQIH